MSPSLEYLQLVTQHQTALYCFIRSIAPGVRDVEDIVQEVNVVLWQKAKNFKMGTNFKAFAFRIAYLKVLEVIRKQARSSELFLDEQSMKQVFSHWSSAEHPNTYALDALDGCLEKLPDSDKELLRFRYFVGKTVRLLASELDTSEGALQQRFFRIRNTLRVCIEQTVSRKGQGV
ncbi:MAG: sigma-70 family RNA polymerase sigma factor [Puniceicoccales bacterium]|nr:sigma-70 family RNA polymerase sigma factor [Puniceicoccales bacterium]